MSHRVCKTRSIEYSDRMEVHQRRYISRGMRLSEELNLVALVWAAINQDCLQLSQAIFQNRIMSKADSYTLPNPNSDDTSNANPDHNPNAKTQMLPPISCTMLTFCDTKVSEEGRHEVQRVVCATDARDPGVIPVAA